MSIIRKLESTGNQEQSELDSCRKSLKIGVQRQRQDNVQTGDKVQVKQTLVPFSPPSPPPDK